MILTIFIQLVLVLSILIQLNQFCLTQCILIFLLSGVHSMFMFWYGVVGCSKNIGWCHPFLTVYFLCIFTGTWCCSVFNGIVWFPILHLVFMDDHDVDHPVVVYTENVLYRSSYTPTSLYIYFYFCSNLSISIHNTI